MFKADELLIVRSTIHSLDLLESFSEEEFEDILTEIISNKNKLINLIDENIEFIYKNIPHYSKEKRRSMLKISRFIHNWKERGLVVPINKNTISIAPISIKENLRKYEVAVRKLDLYIEEYIFRTYLNFNNIMKNDVLFSEALMISTPDFIRYLSKISAKSKKKKLIQANNTFTKYLLRGTLDATPFGLWSGSALGEWDKDNFIVRENFNKYRYKILLNPYLNMDKSLLGYFINPTFFVNSKGLCIWWERKGKSIIYREARINRNLAKELSSLDSIFIDEFKFNKLKNKDLLEENGIIQKVTKPIIPESVPVLIKSLEGKNINHIDRFSKHQELKNLLNTKYSYHVDTLLTNEPITIDSDVKKSLEEAVANLVTLFSNSNAELRIDKLKRKIVEEFGSEPVPLVHASKFLEASNEIKYWEDYLPTNYFLKIIGKQNNRKIKLKSMDSIEDKKILKRNGNKSVEVIFKYNNKNEIYIESINTHVGRTSWRFHHLLDNTEKRKLENSLFKNLKDNNQIIYAEVDYNQGTFADSTIFPTPHHKYKIHIYRHDLESSLSNNSINVSGLYVKYLEREDRLVLTNGLDGLEVIPCFYSPLSFKEDKLVRLLYMFRFQEFPFQGGLPKTFKLFNTSKDEIVHIPRVQIGSWILSLEKWKVPISKFGYNGKLEFKSSIFIKLKELKDELNLPRFVQLSTKSIKASIIDFKNPTTIYLFLKHLSFDTKGEWILIEELFIEKKPNTFTGSREENYISSLWGILNLPNN